MVVGHAGTGFWFQNGTGHFVFFELMLFGLALTPTGSRDAAGAEDPNGLHGDAGRGYDPFEPPPAIESPWQARA